MTVNVKLLRDAANAKGYGCGMGAIVLSDDLGDKSEWKTYDVTVAVKKSITVRVKAPDNVRARQAAATLHPETRLMGNDPSWSMSVHKVDKDSYNYGRNIEATWGEIPKKP